MAVLYRLVMPEHTLPFDPKSKDLLECEGFEVEDYSLETREDTDDTAYQPTIVLFSIAALLALAFVWAALSSVYSRSVRFETSHPRNIHLVE